MAPQSPRRARFSALLAALAVLAAAPAEAAAPAQPVVEEKTAADLAVQLARGETTSVALTEAYLKRVRRLNPALRAVLAVSPDALGQARASDERRKAGRSLGPLDGIPVLIKDNIETRETATTAGSLALKDNRTGRDAPLVAAIRARGAVVLGKTNLSEWANWRSHPSLLGWSAVGGLTRNPYAFDRSPCGSSGGSAVAVAASLAPLAVGTETAGSITCPASLNGVVGFKPTRGLISGTHVVPISPSRDTPGPLAKTVRDAALLFTAMVGRDPADPATERADAHRRDYAAGLEGASLEGLRIGYWKPPMSQALAARFHGALTELRAAGAVLVEVEYPKLHGGDAEQLVLNTEFKAALAAYLATAAPSVKVRTLADVIAFNEANRGAEMAFFGQDNFLKADKTRGLSHPEYLAARKAGEGAAEGLDAMLKAASADLLVTASFGPAWLSDPVHGDPFTGPFAAALPAIAGYPHLTVPMGLVRGLPVGLSFIGPAFSDQRVLSAGHAYEQRTKARVPPAYRRTVDADLGPAAGARLAE